LLEESEETRVAIKHFEELGVSLSLDDFGTGYSSLNYLHKFPFRKIKIDQSFVRNREADRDARAIVEAVANLGASLGKIVVAEGIETEKEMEMVKSLGCHQGQGYFFSAPMTAKAISAKLKSETPKAQLVA
jgi:EAL domain-containing protein (putative c-di-GMP-specific phosphodiesterase class I)